MDKIEEELTPIDEEELQDKPIQSTKHFELINKTLTELQSDINTLI